MQSGGGGGGEFRISVSIGISFPAGLGLENPNSGPDPGGTFFPNSVTDLGSAGTFPKSRNVGPVIDENVCLLDSQPWLHGYWLSTGVSLATVFLSFRNLGES